MSELSERQVKILQAVVVEYVASAEPVASELITQKYSLGIRSATVRNEMVEITEKGYMAQPHTSAGRIPSDEGYRYYVDNIAHPVTVSSKDQSDLKAAANEQDALKEMVAETTKVLSRLTQTLSAALTVRNATLKVRSCVLTALGPEVGLVILVLENGHVENRMVDIVPGATLEDIGKATATLNHLIAGKNLAEVQSVAVVNSSMNPSDRAVRSSITVVQRIACDLMQGYLVTEGEEFIFSQPEFTRHPESLLSLVASMQDEGPWVNSLSFDGKGESEISIGRENGDRPMDQLSIMKHRFYVGNSEAGTLAVIGPTRMNYDRNLSMLKFTAGAITQTLTKLLS